MYLFGIYYVLPLLLCLVFSMFKIHDEEYYEMVEKDYGDYVYIHLYISFCPLINTIFVLIFIRDIFKSK